MLKKKVSYIGATLIIIIIFFLISFIIINIQFIIIQPLIYILQPFTALYAIIIGIYFIKRAKEFNVKLLKYAGFFLITGFVGGLVPINSWMWYPISVSLAMYIGAELLMPNIKKYFMSMLLILLITSEIFLYIIMFCFSNIYNWVVSLEFYVFIFIFLGVNGFGFLYKGIQTKGTISKRFLLLSTAFFVDILHFFGLGDPILNLIIAIVQPPLLYLGLKQKRPKKVKKEKKKIPSKKAIELASYILRKDALIAKMDDIEEQINSTQDKELTLFISYATKDSDLYRIKEVAKILGTYKNIKKVLFWEKDTADNIITYMNENLGKCDAMILFCSKNTLNSVPVQKEWTAAEIMGKPIIPVFYDTNDIPPLLKSRLGVEFNFYDIPENARNLYNLTLKKYFSLKKGIEGNNSSK